MQDKSYLLSLEEVFSKESGNESVQGRLEELLAAGFGRLDNERQKKAEHIKRGNKRIESIGAGLLLQLAVSEADDKPASSEMERVTFSQVLERLERLEAPLPIEYTYGAHGKPYFKNYPFYFSISHSGSYVFCVISEQEIGADIQIKAPKVNERVLQHFFSREEKEYWQQCGTKEEQRDFFYQMWCRKEAYAKLTGEGIADAVRVNMSPTRQIDVCFTEYMLGDEYQIAVCKRK